MKIFVAFIVAVFIFICICGIVYKLLQVNYSDGFALCWSPIITYTLMTLVEIKDNLKRK